MTATTTNPKVRAYYDLADCPDDGGKHALYCEHEDGIGVVQDTNRRRLVPWLQSTVDWCPYCQGGGA